MQYASKIAFILVIVGAVNWGLIGVFNFDLVAKIFGASDQGATIPRLLYTIVGLAGVFYATRVAIKSSGYENEGT